MADASRGRTELNGQVVNEGKGCDTHRKLNLFTLIKNAGSELEHLT